MSELFYLILPESDTSPKPTISFAKKKGMDAGYVSALINDLKNIMWIYDIEDYKIMYDINNIISFLDFFEIEEKKELYSIATRMRLLLKDGRFKQCVSLYKIVEDKEKINVKGEEQTIWNVFCEIAKLKEKNHNHPIAVLNKQIFDIHNERVINLTHNGQVDAIPILPIENINTITDWFAEKRIPKRLYEWNPKHGENGKGQHAALKQRGFVSVLRSDRNYPQALVGKAYGQNEYTNQDPKNNLYIYDPENGAFLRFVPGGARPNTYHAFHISNEDVPNEIKKKYKIIDPELLVD